MRFRLLHTVDVYFLPIALGLGVAFFSALCSVRIFGRKKSRGEGQQPPQAVAWWDQECGNLMVGRLESGLPLALVEISEA